MTLMDLYSLLEFSLWSIFWIIFFILSWYLITILMLSYHKFNKNKSSYIKSILLIITIEFLYIYVLTKFFLWAYWWFNLSLVSTIVFILLLSIMLFFFVKYKTSVLKRIINKKYKIILLFIPTIMITPILWTNFLIFFSPLWRVL